MPRKIVPYIGVTGFMTPEEVAFGLKAITKTSERKLMVGVLMSSKTLRGEENKWPSRYPKREVVSSLFTDHPKALNLIHYNTDNAERLCEDLTEMTKLAGPNLHGFQLNIPFPPLEALDKYLNTNPEILTVLQISKEMLKLSPRELRKRLFPEYRWMANHFLLDGSGGHGLPLDAQLLGEYLDELQILRAGLGVAGGLGPTSLDLLEDLPERFRDLSIDAEGRLRSSQPEDKLDTELMKKYVKRARRVFSDND